MNIVNFLLWLVLVSCGGIGVGSLSRDSGSKLVAVISIILYVALIVYLASVLHPLGGLFRDLKRVLELLL